MFKKVIMALTVLFVLMLALSSVNAFNNDTIDVVNVEEVNDKIVYEEDNSPDTSINSPEDFDDQNYGKEVLSSNEEDMISLEEDKDILSNSELHVAVYETSMYFGESEQIHLFIMPANGKYDFDLKISEISTGKVIISKNFKGTATNNFDTYYTIPSGVLDIGRYYMGVFRKSDNYHMDNALLDVNAIYSPVTVEDTTIYYGSGGHIYMTVKPSTFTCKYDFHISIYDLNYNLVHKSKRMYSFKPTTSVKYSIAPASLKPGDYYVVIENTGSGSADDCILKVLGKKATPKLTAVKKTFKKSVKTKKYTVTLKNNINSVMKNTKVTLKVNKKTYTGKTNSKGKATFKITKLTKKGKYAATVTFNGNNYYNKVTKKVKIIVK